jgi:hypothetical protein
MQSQSERDSRIRDRAYHIWLSEGRRHGSHDAHWRQAEREIEAEEVGGSGTKKTGSARAVTDKAKAPVTSEARPATVSRASADAEGAKKPRTRSADAASADATAPARRGRPSAPVKPGA